MSDHAPCVSKVVITVGAIGGAYLAYRTYQDYQQKARIPTEWTHVGSLSNMYTYPVKSCAPVVVDKAECSVLGLKNGWLRDRVLMVVDQNMNFVTARGLHDLLLIHPSVKSSVLTLQHTEQEPVHIDLAEIVSNQKPTTARVWGTPVQVYDCGYEPSEWISRLINKSTDNYRLVYYAQQKPRGLRSTANAFYKFTKNDTGALPDEVSYNLINEASVADLNTRLRECQVTHRNFRPNFVLKGTVPAYDEDNWSFVKIGENIFEIIKPCTRCILTTIDPETGVKNMRAEPLETLKSYRQISNPVERKTAGSSPMMGLQLALRSGPGVVVSIHDPVYVAYK